MKINLLKIPVYFINLEKEIGKYIRVSKMLKEIGFKDVRPFVVKKHKDGPLAGCADSHHKIMEIEKNNNSPFIILEDDCMLFDPSEKFNYIVDIPDHADALYLGLSIWGRYANYSGPYVNIKEYNNKISRIYNMLGTHAILYISKDYINFAKRAAEFSSKNSIHIDVTLAENHKIYNIYALNKPIFYQETQELVTKNTLPNYSAFENETQKMIYEGAKKNNKNYYLESIGTDISYLDNGGYDLYPLFKFEEE